MKYKTPLTVTEAELKAMTFEQLRNIASATFGITHDWDTKENMLPKLIFRIDRLYHFIEENQ